MPPPWLQLTKMSKPVLLIIAGCNGAGKSSFSKLLAENDFEPFDYDYFFLKFYHSLPDSELRDKMAHHFAFEELEKKVSYAISNQQNFCYETNFNSTPLHWPDIFKSHGFEIRMIYLCLNSIIEAKKRVAIRVANGGHFVPDLEVEQRYTAGFLNLNQHFNFFDKIDLFDVSQFGQIPQHVLSVENQEILFSGFFPQYLLPLVPDILKLRK